MKMAGSLDGSDAEEWNAMADLLRRTPVILGPGKFMQYVELEMLWNAGVRYADFQAAVTLAERLKHVSDDAWGFIRTVAFTRAAHARDAEIRLGRAPSLHLLTSAVTKPWKESE